MVEDGLLLLESLPSHFTLLILQVKQPVLTFGVFALDLFDAFCVVTVALATSDKRVSETAAAILIEAILEWSMKILGERRSSSEIDGRRRMESYIGQGVSVPVVDKYCLQSQSQSQPCQLQ